MSERDWIIIGRPITMREIAQRHADASGLTLEALRGTRRDRKHATPRRAAMAECYATGNFSFPQIGRFFNRDHTTVLYALRRAEGETHDQAKTPRALAQQEAA